MVRPFSNLARFSPVISSLPFPFQKNLARFVPGSRMMRAVNAENKAPSRKVAAGPRNRISDAAGAFCDHSGADETVRQGIRLVPRNTGLPLLGSLIAALLEPCEEGPIEVERARLAEPFDAILRGDAVKAQPLQLAT
jgi:hypothetical protein